MKVGLRLSKPAPGASATPPQAMERRSTSPNRPSAKQKGNPNAKCFVFVTAPTRKKPGYEQTNSHGQAHACFAPWRLVGLAEDVRPRGSERVVAARQRDEGAVPRREPLAQLLGHR